MKVSIIISDGIKQIMFTPENDSEKQTLKMISPDDNIELAVKKGSFHSKASSEVAGFRTDMCQGGYLRTWTDENSIMLVLTPKPETK